MKRIFAKTSNVNAFLSTVSALEGRGAREASWAAVISQPGRGKTKTLEWYAVQTGAALIRAKHGYTASWFLRDLCATYNIQTARSGQIMFGRVVEYLANLDDQKIIVDEIDHAVQHGVIEVLRDLSDLLDVEIIIAGHEGVMAKLGRFPQITSRISEVVEFKPPTAADVMKIAEVNLEGVTIAEDLAELILVHCHNRMRQVLQALGKVERAAKKGNIKTATVANMGDKARISHWQDQRRGAAA